MSIFINHSDRPTLERRKKELETLIEKTSDSFLIYGYWNEISLINERLRELPADSSAQSGFDADNFKVSRQAQKVANARNAPPLPDWMSLG